MSGTHSRHLFVHSKIMNMGHECSAIVMEREEIIPKIYRENSEFLQSDIDNFNMHFQKRYEIENKTYGICRVTGKLISKDRLKLVPHATLSIEAKNLQK